MENDYRMISTTLKRVLVAVSYDALTRKIIEIYSEASESFIGSSWTMEVLPPAYDENFCMATVLIHVNYGIENNSSNKQ